ncbi:SMODS domain-containing nucleotidyltransferase [Alkalibacterium olivapovliticus]|uniref:Nucleotidyltransferase-like protein n=1 Tax=Alkalibacterium olivapovliticus TaxID=99907 RepID=A0A2T0W8W4_9LACT|nr:nucleotidyltransferase domain-containing protein [Alkalibacterium olivapovliticus]PRY83129.1 nucleotidyltransferase-like protein [Alkalibacterium olivapovliticus]
MTVDGYLSTLSNELVIRDSKKDSITLSILTLNIRLKSYFGSEVVDIIKFGSYSRGTILPRNFDEKSDVDVMVIFKNEHNFKPQTFLDKLKRFASAKYSTSEVYQSSPTIVLELNHIKFELVPANKVYSWSNDTYNIPKSYSTWMLTHPKSFDDTLVECNKNNNYKMKPIIRLLKYWNIKKNYRELASFGLEKKTAEEMGLAYFFCSSYSDYVKEGLKTIRTYNSSYRFDLAIDKINQALTLEKEGKLYAAEIKIKEVFPGD